MENAEEIFQCLDDFSKRKSKPIPRELEEYLAYVARTGDPVYQWSTIKCLFKEKLLNVITDFYETSPGLDIPHCPNVDPFNYDAMKNSLLERIDSFSSAPFTVQRICELLTAPRKQYNRIDKFMRAIEKNVLVVSTREPGVQRHVEQENGEQLEPMVNGSDNNSDYNVDVEMEDMSWKENLENPQPQPSSSDSITDVTVNNIEAKIQEKQDISEETQKKIEPQYESVTPPDVTALDETVSQSKPIDDINPVPHEPVISKEKTETMNVTDELPSKDEKVESESTTELPPSNMTMNIPEIRIDNAEVTEQKLNEKVVEVSKEDDTNQPNSKDMEDEIVEENTNKNSDQSMGNGTNTENDNKSTDLITQKHVPEAVSISSEESSSSSDNTDGNSNSPKTDNEVHEESNQSTTDSEEKTNDKDLKLSEIETGPNTSKTETSTDDVNLHIALQSDDYSISDVKSELPQRVTEGIVEQNEEKMGDTKDLPMDTKTVSESSLEEKPDKESEISSELDVNE